MHIVTNMKFFEINKNTNYKFKSNSIDNYLLK